MTTKENENIPTSIEEIFEDILKKDPNLIVTKIKGELNKLIEDCVLENSSSNEIYTIGRSGLHLFETFFSVLMEHGFNVGVFRTFRLMQIQIIKGEEIKENENILLLVDAINKGDEIEKVIDTLGQSRINKIVGYIIRENTKEKLKEKYPNIDFCFFHIAQDKKEYVGKHNELTTFFHSKLTPLDSEHHYKKLMINTNETDKVKYLVKEALKNTIGVASKDIIESTEKLHFNPKNNIKYSLELENRETIKGLYISNDIKGCVETDRLQVRIRGRAKHSSFEFSLLPLCIPEILDPSNLSKICIDLGIDCGVSKLSDENPEKKIKVCFCSDCLEKILSKRFSEALIEQLKMVCKDEGFNVHGT